MPCTSGDTPVIIDVCEGRVRLGMMVRASSEYAPSRIIRCRLLAPEASMASARSPSMEMTTTCRVGAPARSGA
jgi:hypothetical protein